MRARSSAVTMPRVASTRRMCSVTTSHSSKNACLLRAAMWPSACARSPRGFARPHLHPHAERLAVARHRPADPAVAEYAQGSCRAGLADSDLPVAGLERRHLLRDPAHGRQDQPECQLGRRIGRGARMLARRYDHAEPRTGVDVDMRIDAALADQFELLQALEQRRPDVRAFADQHQDFGFPEPRGQRPDVLDVIVPDLHVVAVEFAETRERAHSVVSNRRGSICSLASPCLGRCGRSPPTRPDAFVNRRIAR